MLIYLGGSYKSTCQWLVGERISEHINYSWFWIEQYLCCHSYTNSNEFVQSVVL